MQHHKHEENEQLLTGLYNQMRSVLDKSNQPVFIYLDDKHKVCNQRFADFLGYKTPQELSSTEGFLEVFIDDEASRNAFMSAYWSAINNLNASGLEVTWRKKDNSTVRASVIIVPTIYEGHILSVQFITGM
jgi:PAS domain-containing protein